MQKILLHFCAANCQDKKGVLFMSVYVSVWWPVLCMEDMEKPKKRRGKESNYTNINLHLSEEL